MATLITQSMHVHALFFRPTVIFSLHIFTLLFRFRSPASFLTRRTLRCPVGRLCIADQSGLARAHRCVFTCCSGRFCSAVRRVRRLLSRKWPRAVRPKVFQKPTSRRSVITLLVSALSRFLCPFESCSFALVIHRRLGRSHLSTLFCSTHLRLHYPTSWSSWPFGTTSVSSVARSFVHNPTLTRAKRHRLFSFHFMNTSCL